MTDYTKVPATIDALVAMFKTALPAFDAAGAIFDGPPTVDLPADYAAVGYNLSLAGSGLVRPALPSVLGTQDISDMGNDWVSESFEVQCHISSNSGDAAMAPLRNVVLTNFGLVAAQLAADRSLGGVIPLPHKATIGRFEWYLEQGPDVGGASVTLIFAVVCAFERVV